MDWTILFNACASALGGTATALIVIGCYGNKLFDFWFRKGYKEWESELEQRLKQEFARYERKLDALTAREQTKFELAHPDRVSAVKEVYKLCKELQVAISELCILRSLIANGKNQNFIESLKQSNFSILDKLAAPNKYIVEHDYYFEETYTTTVTDFVGYGATLIANESQTSMTDFAEANRIMNEKLKIIGNAIKELIGS